jgi:shikimate dehydrogenase
MAVRSYKSELVGVFGYPVAENPTVVMMEAAFRALGLDWRYLTVEVSPGSLAEAMKGMRAFGMRGVNLTMPHKVAVLDHLDAVADDARLIGAVNTVIAREGRLLGENTDGKGFIESLTSDRGVDVRKARVLILGAGGAARAIAVELALRGAPSLAIANRSAARGEALAMYIGEKTNCETSFLPWSSRISVPGDVDVLVNATSIGLYPDTEAMPDIDFGTIRPGMVVCDVIPNPPRTAFLAEAERQGAAVLDGLGMLVNQGAIGFRHWTGLAAPVAAMREALAREFAS